MGLARSPLCKKIGSKKMVLFLLVFLAFSLGLAVSFGVRDKFRAYTPNNCTAPQTKNDWIFRSSRRNPTSFTQNHVS